MNFRASSGLPLVVLEHCSVQKPSMKPGLSSGSDGFSSRSIGSTFYPSCRAAVAGSMHGLMQLCDNAHSHPRGRAVKVFAELSSFRPIGNWIGGFVRPIAKRPGQPVVTTPCRGRGVQGVPLRSIAQAQTSRCRATATIAIFRRLMLFLHVRS